MGGSAHRTFTVWSSPQFYRRSPSFFSFPLFPRSNDVWRSLTLIRPCIPSYHPSLDNRVNIEFLPYHANWLEPTSCTGFGIFLKNRLQTNFNYVIVAYINLWFIYDSQIFLTLSFLTITINPHPCNKLHILAPSKVSAQ